MNGRRHLSVTAAGLDKAVHQPSCNRVAADAKTTSAGKRLEILKEILPKMTRVLAFYDPSNRVVDVRKT